MASRKLSQIVDEFESLRDVAREGAHLTDSRRDLRAFKEGIAYGLEMAIDRLKALQPNTEPQTPQ